MSKTKIPQPVFPSQHQNQHPGLESLMNPKPVSEDSTYTGSGKLREKVAIISGGDSGIGKAVQNRYKLIMLQSNMYKIVFWI